MAENQDNAETENASELLFPEGFAKAEPLMISEVNLLLEHRVQKNQTSEEEEEYSEIFSKFHNYTNRLSRFKNRETVSNIRAFLGQRQLHPFEVAQLGNLVPQTVEEAKSLIPSLEGRFQDDEIEYMTEYVSGQKNFAY